MPVRYTRVGWQDAPSTDTPIDAANLNHMDNGILALSQEVDTELDSLREDFTSFEEETSSRVITLQNSLPTMIGEQIDTKFGDSITDEITSWLNSHVDPAGSAVVVDDSLSVEGAAADAEKTGTLIRKNAWTGVCSTGITTQDKVINLDDATGYINGVYGTNILVNFLAPNKNASPRLKVGSGIAYPVAYPTSESPYYQIMDAEHSAWGLGVKRFMFMEDCWLLMNPDFAHTDSEFDEIKDGLNIIENVPLSAPNPVWEVGGLSSSTGEPIISTTRKRTADYIWALKGSVIQIASGYRFAVCVYDEGKIFTAYKGLSGDTYTLANDAFIKIAFADNLDSDASTLDPSVLKLDVYSYNFKPISEALNKVRYSSETITNYKSGYIATSGSQGSTIDLTPVNNNQYVYAVVPVKAYDYAVISGKGGNAPRVWCLVDADYKIISNAVASTTVTNYKLRITDDGYLILNAVITQPYSGYIYHQIDDTVRLHTQEISSNKTDILANKSDITTLENDNASNHLLHNYAADMTAGKMWNYGTGTLPSNPSNSSTLSCIEIPCNVGDVFILKGNGRAEQRLYMFINSSREVISASTATNPYALMTTRVVTAPSNAVAVCVNFVTAEINDSFIYRFDFANGKTKDVIRSMSAISNNMLMPVSVPTEYTELSAVPHDVTTNQSLSQIYGFYDSLITAYPNYVTKTLLGKDESDTYDIFRYDFTPMMVRIGGSVTTLTDGGTNYTNDDIPTIIMQACIHGGEKPCAVALANLMTLIATAEGGALSWLKNNIHFVIIPVVNPYGYETLGDRWNVNHVDLNRNFPTFWGEGSRDASGDRYRGESALSEVESQYVNDILEEYAEKAIAFFDWHTYGVFTSYDNMTAFVCGANHVDELQQIANNVIKAVTDSGHKNHNLPANSGYIGNIQLYAGSIHGSVSNHGAYAHGIPSASPEIMYHYYGETETYNTDTNCMNVEFMLETVMGACHKFLNGYVL